MTTRTIVLAASLGLAAPVAAGQAPFAAATQDVPISGRDRVYAAEQFSNTVSVVDPSTNRLLGVIRLGEPQPANFSPLYREQVLVHGMGFAPDGQTIAVVSIGSNAVSFIDTATNAVKHTTYIGRSPHEAFFTPNGREVWVTVRGEDYVAVLDAKTYAEIARVRTPGGPGMTIFLAGRPLRLRLFVVQPAARRVRRRDARRGRAGRAAQPVLPQPRRNARRDAGSGTR